MSKPPVQVTVIKKRGTRLSLPQVEVLDVEFGRGNWDSLSVPDRELTVEEQGELFLRLFPKSIVFTTILPVTLLFAAGSLVATQRAYLLQPINDDRDSWEIVK